MAYIPILTSHLTNSHLPILILNGGIPGLLSLSNFPSSCIPCNLKCLNMKLFAFSKGVGLHSSTVASVDSIQCDQQPSIHPKSDCSKSIKSGVFGLILMEFPGAKLCIGCIVNPHPKGPIVYSPIQHKVCTVC